MALGINETATMFKVVSICVLKVEARGYKVTWVSFDRKSGVILDATKNGSSFLFQFDQMGEELEYV